MFWIEDKNKLKLANDREMMNSMSLKAPNNLLIACLVFS